MKLSILSISAIAVSANASALLESRQSNWTVGQTVQTSSGPVDGHPSLNNSQVSEYLGIPFAKPPVGDLRFAAPVAYNGTTTINGTNFGYTCPAQTTTYNATVIAQSDVTSTGLGILSLLGGLTAQSEDCLTLNVWTKPQTGDSKKAVLMWIYGGAFSSGASATPAYIGQYIVEQEDVIVVTFNYRLNIFGFSGSPDSPANVGLLDQRLAVEWVRDNIENFGGDASRITLFGQSAGSASVDLYNYAWVQDPIVAGFIQESGTAQSWGMPSTAEYVATAWYNVSEALGCGGASASNVTSCMRTKNTTEILSGISVTTDSPGSFGILGSFLPTVDEIVVFSNYTERSLAGNFTSKPLLIGSNDDEAVLFVTANALQGVSTSDAAAQVINLIGFTCPSGYRANYSTQANVNTWRYRYFGSFPNTMIVPNAGAWHAAEIPLLFDTNLANPPETTEQIAIGKYMRGAWAAFAKNPENGLTTYGWPKYDAAEDTLIRLAYNNQTGTNAANPSLYDANCPTTPVFSMSMDNATSTSTGTSTSSSSLGSAPSTVTTSDGISLESGVLGLVLAVIIGSHFLLKEIRASLIFL
ncbi:putative carboxylesterase protein [Botrytis fragariae]|uniref:Carboxylic ester hydrolase n=1 Tax=Botrytis fragariae TaxID=1964551 RepID=A0A8H6EP76_9HELO|nr:putative carboxylesterase protein [Botrytis fragariae]KAF5879482.1 putative carboxylesterase protein [Botrytis fragariae]